MESTGTHRNQHIPGDNTLRTQSIRCIHDAGSGCREVVLVRFHEPRVLCGLTADQSTTGLLASGGNTLDDRRHPHRIHRPGGDVVGEEQGLGSTDDEVVHHHRDKVNPDRVVDAHSPGDSDLGSHTVGAGR